MVRETFIREQDIANDQLIDTHPKPGTNLRKLVDKKVRDPVFLINFPVSGFTTRLDLSLLDQPVAAGPTDVGILTTEKHSIFVTGSDDAVPDPFGKEVVGVLTVASLATDQVAMTVGLNTGVATMPATFAVGDIVRIIGQGLTTTFLAQISNILGNVLTFVIVGTATPKIFVEGPSGNYTMRREPRFTMSWQDSTSAPFSVPAGNYDIGVQKRVFLADVTELFGSGGMPHPEEQPDVGLDSLARTKIDQIIAWMLSVNGGPTTIDSWRIQVHKHLEEIFITDVAGITHLRLIGQHKQTTHYSVDPGSTVNTSHVAEVNMYRNGLLQAQGIDYFWDFETDLITFTPSSLPNEIFIVKEEIKCYDTLPLIPTQFNPGVPAPVAAGKPNQIPNVPVFVNQFEADCSTVVADFGVSATDTICVRGTDSDPDNQIWEADSVREEIEVRFDTDPFTGTPNVLGPFVPNGSTTDLLFNPRTVIGDSPSGCYHYKKRTRDINGAVSAFEAGEHNICLASILFPVSAMVQGGDGFFGGGPHIEPPGGSITTIADARYFLRALHPTMPAPVIGPTVFVDVVGPPFVGIPMPTFAVAVGPNETEYDVPIFAIIAAIPPFAPPMFFKSALFFPPFIGFPYLPNNPEGTNGPGGIDCNIPV